jgi:hypothetical protein
MLGSEHPFGKLLSRAMKHAKKTVLEPAAWFHAIEQDRPFLLRPQTQIIKAGRYHHIGQSVLYLGCDEKTAAVERLRWPQSGKRLDIVKIKVTERIDVLDLRSFFYGEVDPLATGILRFAVRNGFVSEPTTDVDDSRPQYRIPQFIADLARRKQFRGILFNSTRPSAYNNPEAVGHNLVIFDPTNATCVVERRSTIHFGLPDYDVMTANERWPLEALHSLTI